MNHPTIMFASVVLGCFIGAGIIVFGGKHYERQKKEQIEKCKRDGDQVIMKGKLFQGCLIKH